MASTFTTNFGLEEIGSGEQSGTWGDTTNFNFDILDRIVAYKAVALSGTTHNLTVREASPGSGTENLQDGMHRVIKFTGALGGDNTITVAPNTAATYFIFENATTDSGSSGPYSVIISQGSGANVTIENGRNAIVYCDGAGSGAAVINALGDLQVDTLTGTLSTAAQPNITSLGTLTSLTVDDIAVDGKVITMTGSADDTAVLTVAANGALSIVTTDDAAAAADIQITADGTVDIDSAGILTLDSGAAINIEPASGAAILLDDTISVDAGVVTGATSITSTAFVGDITGDVTGNASGTAATVTAAAQPNITSLGTLTALTVDDVAIDGKVITMTGSSGDTAVFTVAANGALSIVTTDDAAAAANIQITADGTVDIDSAGVLTLDSGAAINIEPASGSAILLDGTISVDAGVVTGATSITSTAFVGDITGDVTGNVSGTAATVTTAAQGNITSLGTLTSVVIADDGNIGSASDTDAIAISSGGMVTFSGTNPRLTGSGNTYQSSGEYYLGRDAAGNYAQTEADGFITYYDADSYTYIRNQDGTGGVAVFHARRGGSAKSEIEENGDFLSATGSYGTISDERLKEHIIDSGSQWNDVKAMRIRKYSFIEDETDGPTQLGVIAQELEASGMGGLVKTHADVDSDDNPKLDEDGNPTDFKSVKLSILYMKAVKALQEAMERIESLESRIEALES